MATFRPTPQRALQLLDPTKIATRKEIRKPPVDRNTVIQGSIRDPTSNAYKDFRFKQGVRLRKALQFLTHGRDIFAYHNVRTNQVVYSLTRYLEKNNVLSQMIYHGKKTVPATLRKDMWVPYYSVHFDEPKTGLRTYQLLREFSTQRQLDPPRHMITITEEFLQRKRPRDQEKAEEFDEKYDGKVGKLMEPKDRRKAVMNQKATSVADVAAALAIQEEEKKAQEGEKAQEEKTAVEGQQGEAQGAEATAEGAKSEAKAGATEEKQPKRPTKAAERRKRHAERRQEILAKQTASAIATVEEILSKGEEPVKVQLPESTGSNQVKLLWSDLQDAQYARSWPENVLHGELALSRDHVMPGEKEYDPEESDDPADEHFAEKTTWW